VEGESEKERIVVSYAENACVKSGKPNKVVYLVNATGTDEMIVDFAAKPALIEAFDVLGKAAGERVAAAGLVRLAVPKSGYVRVSWQ
jgi:hypothetical protein